MRFLLVFSFLVGGCFFAGNAGDLHEPDWSSRSILAVRRQAVISSEVSYKIRRIAKEMGESFQAGDVLVEFADEMAQAGATSARAAFSAAQVALAAVENMYGRNNASLLELETAKRDLEAARSRLTLAEYELEACVITAPFAGRVAEVYVNEHELVSRGTRLLSIVDDSSLLVKFLLSESAFGTVATGERLLVSVPSLGLEKEAVISHIAAVMDPASRTFDVWAGVDNADGRLRAGMIASIVPAERSGE